MHAATAYVPPCRGLKDLRERGLRPAIGFTHPRDVLKDPDLDLEARRAILSSWASDASAVENWPTLRWLYGTPAPVPFSEVMAALDRLDAAFPPRCAGRRDRRRAPALAAAL